MDRTRPAGFLIPSLLIVLAAASLAATRAGDLMVIHAARWLAPGVDPARALATRMSECLPPIADPDRRYSVEIGRAAFRSPLLLGGQASRAGVSCETCHQGGRNNADFDFPGLSGPPGTADVTTALFSSHRDDGIDNPKPIPDLSGPKTALKISQEPTGRALETFLHGTITEEFDGAEPSPAVLQGLADYVRALGPTTCPADKRVPLRAEDDLANAVRAVRVAAEALDRGDRPTAVAMLAAARSQLGLANERYDAPDAAPVRAALATASVDLADSISAIRAGKTDANVGLIAWLAREPAWGRVVIAQEPGSLFNPHRLAAAGPVR